jgi:hypothetical protein
LRESPLPDGRGDYEEVHNAALLNLRVTFADVKTAAEVEEMARA